jgi:hypothetical protein
MCLCHRQHQPGKLDPVQVDEDTLERGTGQAKKLVGELEENMNVGHLNVVNSNYNDVPVCLENNTSMPKRQ